MTEKEVFYLQSSFGLCGGRLSFARCGGLHFLDKQKQPGQSCLMPLAVEEQGYLVKRYVEPGLFDHAAGLRHFKPDKHVTLAILPFAGLEKRMSTARWVSSAMLSRVSMMSLAYVM